jgi:hypothetical protein
MTDRTAQELGEELERLMREHLEHLRNQTFTWVSEEEYQKEEVLLRRIREVCADYLIAIRRSHTDHD